jgi:hypothetical protein
MVNQETYHQRAMDKLRTGEGPSLRALAAEMDAQGLDSSLVRQYDRSFRGQYVVFGDALRALGSTIWRALTATSR